MSQASCAEMLDYCKVQNIPTAQSSSVGLLPSSILQHQDLTKQLSNLPKVRASQQCMCENRNAEYPCQEVQPVVSAHLEIRQQKQQYTNQLAKETDKYIKEFGSLPTTPSEQRQRKIQKDRLVAEFTTSLTNFQKAQRQAAEREKEFVARVRASSRVSGGFPEDSSKEKNLVSWESQTQPQVQIQDEEITEDDLRLIHERESSIRQLEADIMDINEIFKDLGMMIHEQGDVIAQIQENPLYHHSYPRGRNCDYLSHHMGTERLNREGVDRCMTSSRLWRQILVITFYYY
ncbi:hypothetical protein U0070_017912 [Myodes glareolus]|uniref:Syntaxin-7 n=1 Tax=Myodes glareolus TaxID=447135 RepID=A0AAW0K9X7_MYOGA